jgi:uncharacterized membrane protein
MTALAHQPFGTSWLFLLDTLRVATILLDVWLIVWVLVTAKGLLPPTRQWGCGALALFMAAGIWTNFDRLGQQMAPPLVFAVAGTVCTVIYVHRVRSTENWKRGKRTDEAPPPPTRLRKR